MRQITEVLRLAARGLSYRQIGQNLTGWRSTASESASTSRSNCCGWNTRQPTRAFLNHLEADRHTSVRTRNVRLAAVHSIFRHAALHRPDDAAIIQRVLAIPPKCFERTLVSYLTEVEISAPLAAPDRGTWSRCRQSASVALASSPGMRPPPTRSAS
ncbi:MAG TPA: hypothetical protein VKV73_06345 [Chloroflexota bacterium]|nr:hypothetical protein [Chloroflexota bacterium]